MARLVLTDASPLIGLARLEALHWLQTLFGVVSMPEEVRDEVFGSKKFPEEEIISAAIDAAWLRVCDPAPSYPNLPELDEGEAACIRIALEHGGPVLLLMDERAGRAVAMEHGLPVAGTAAIIGMAKSCGLISSAREVFARLHATDFRISAQVITTVLERVGEK
jgi:predicted nucleic acid-binding protein